MKSFYLSAILIVTGLAVSAQKNQKDDPYGRAQFDVLKYEDPLLGDIPRSIRTKELKFAENIRSRSRSASAPASVWENRGPFNVGGRTRALAVDVNSEDIILAGGVSGGVWKTIDQGQTWTKTTSPNDLQAVSCIVQDPRTGETDTWYYGTGEFTGNSAGGSGAPYRGDGIFKSTDGGDSWTVLASTSTDIPQIFDQNFDYNFNITIDPGNGDVYVANYGGIYRSQDGGTSFANVLADDSEDWTAIVVSSTGTFYAVITSGAAPGVYQSADGTTWTEISGNGLSIGNGDRKSLALAPSNEDILYLIGVDGGNSDGVALWKFDDSIDTWTDLSDNLPQFTGPDNETFNAQLTYDQLISVKTDDPDFVVVGSLNLHKSEAGFSTASSDQWIGGYVNGLTSYATYLNHHPDQHAFAFLSGTRAISANDGGLQITDDITSSFIQWTSLNNGYLTTQAYAISVGPGDQIMAGFQDNSSWLTNSAASDATWTDQFGGDGAYNAFNLDGTTRWVSSQRGNIWRYTFTDADDNSSNSGFDFIPDDLGYGSDLFIAPFSVDKETDIFYLGGDVELFINQNASTSDANGMITGTDGSLQNSWVTVNLQSPRGGQVSEFGVTGTNMVYVGTSSGGLLKVKETDGEPVVENITYDNFPNGYISSIAVNPYDIDEVLVTFSNYSVLSVFHSTDGGTTWTEVGGTLEENPDGSGSGPSVRASTIMGDSFKYYVGTSTGLYSTSTIDGSSTVWTQEEAGLIGNVVVEHMVSRKDGLLAIGTHGNGIYTTEIPFFNADLKPQKIIGNIASVGTSSENVTVNILNLGEVDQTGFNASLYVNDVLVISDDVLATVSALSNYEHTFSLPYEFTVADSYDIRITVSLPGDEDTSNDELLETVTVLGRPSDVSLDILTVAENEDIGTTVGSLSTTDIDDTDGHIYSLADGDGDTDNTSFTIDGEALLTGEVFNFSEQVSYTIRIQTADKDGNVFAKSFSIDVSDVLGIDGLEQHGITIFPNPAKNRISLEMINDYQGKIEVRVLSLSGKEVIRTQYEKNQKSTRSLLNLSKLSTGTYVVKINMGGEEITSRLIKE